MDYPKSVPGVGLVDGQFVDEDQVNGTPGSLIPAQWGNDVTEEILNVVREVGDEPDEAQKNQLVGSIWKMFRLATAAATEALRGVVRIGTQIEVNAGESDDVAVTPLKLRFGFMISLGDNGYIVFPSWLAGLILQWGNAATTASGTTHGYPLAFPNSVFQVLGSDAGTIGVESVAVQKSNLSQFNAKSSTGTVGFSFFALGR
ncbi:hypothetical protein [Pseudomonas sp. GD04158]|uniref:gp53-like domain-containing protein n=1 Tax=Pseudomonas sp. GD04158 TaxID=2975439 RepID=UPI003260873D